jgi:Carbohydrate family 9 binding domain-like
MPVNLLRSSLVAIAICCACITLAGQPRRTIQVPRAAAAPRIDGHLTDPAWKSAIQVTGFTDYVTGALVQDQTIVYAMHDEQYIYFGFDCRDIHPASITARETVRDTKFNNNNGPTNTEDNVEIDIDPFCTHSYADLNRFSVNALGTRSAATAEGRGSKAEWKGDWDAASVKTSSGWTCTIRIPWASMHYPVGKDTVPIGINFSRYIDRTKTVQEWSTTGPQGFLENEGMWTNAQPPKQAFKSKLSLLPYVLAGDVNNQAGGKIGMDGRYTLTPQLTAVGTLNPDYSNVEGSIQSISYSHSVHFIPETRSFFTEGGNEFGTNVNFNDIGVYLYSEAIQRFDLGEKLYGKIDPNDSIGLLDTETFDSRNDLAARFLHNFSATSSAGAMVVSSNQDDVSSSVGEADTHFRWGKAGLEGEASGSEGPGAGGGAELISASYQDKKFTSVLQYSGISNNFSTPDGYFPFIGYKGFLGFENYSENWRHGFWQNANLSVQLIDWYGLDNRSYYQGGGFSYNVTTRSDWYVEFDYSLDKFQGLPDNYYNFQITKGLTNRFAQFGLQVSPGIQGGASETLIGPTASVRVLKKLDLVYSGLIQNRLGVIQQHILTANYELSPTRSFGGRMSTQNSDTNVYLFFHESGGKGTEIYLLFGNPDSLRTSRSLQVKLVFSI